MRIGIFFLVMIIGLSVGITSSYEAFGANLPTFSIMDDATGGRCIAIGIWNFDTKTCNLTGKVNAHIIIGGDGITLDGKNNLLRGDDTGIGISLEDRKNVIIKNIRVKHFENGIVLRDSDENIVRDSKFKRNTDQGASLINSDDNLLNRIVVKLSGKNGLKVDSNSENNKVKNSVGGKNDRHGFKDTSSSNVFVNNLCRNNDLGGSIPTGLCQPQA